MPFRLVETAVKLSSLARIELSSTLLQQTERSLKISLCDRPYSGSPLTDAHQLVDIILDAVLLPQLQVLWLIEHMDCVHKASGARLIGNNQALSPCATVEEADAFHQGSRGDTTSGEQHGLTRG